MAELQKSQSKRQSSDVALSFTKHAFSKVDHQEKNLVFSSLPLQAAHSVMAAGSEGRTLDKLPSFLRFGSIDDLTTFFSQIVSPLFSSGNDAAAPAPPSSRHLSFANGIRADDSLSLSHSFKQLAATHYKETLASLDFKTQVYGFHDEYQMKDGKAWQYCTDAYDYQTPSAIIDSTVFGFHDEYQMKDGKAWQYCTDAYDYQTPSAIIDSTVFGFYDEYQMKDGKAWQYCTDAFDYQTPSAIIDIIELCNHGGIQSGRGAKCSMKVARVREKITNDQSRAKKKPRAPAKKAILVGMCYPHDENYLFYSMHEIELLAGLLSTYFKFKKKNIKLLCDQGSYVKPTLPTVQTKLLAMLDNSVDGDVLLIHIVGHGFNGELHQEEPYILTSDDDRLTESFFTAFIKKVKPGVRLFIILSCCNAASMCKEAINTDNVVVFALSGEFLSTYSGLFYKAVLRGDNTAKAFKCNRRRKVGRVFEIWNDAIEDQHQYMKIKNAKKEDTDETKCMDMQDQDMIGATIHHGQGSASSFVFLDFPR